MSSRDCMSSEVTMLVGKKAGRRLKRFIDKAVGSLELRLIRTAGFVPHFNECS